jgi:hypothetical protein
MSNPAPTKPTPQRVAMGTRVVLTNPNYPDIRYEGALVDGPRATLGGYHYTHSYATYTVRDDEGTLHRSEGVLARV